MLRTLSINTCRMAPPDTSTNCLHWPQNYSHWRCYSRNSPRRWPNNVILKNKIPLKWQLSQRIGRQFICITYSLIIFINMFSFMLNQACKEISWGIMYILKDTTNEIKRDTKRHKYSVCSPMIRHSPPFKHYGSLSRWLPELFMIDCAWENYKDILNAGCRLNTEDQALYSPKKTPPYRYGNPHFKPKMYNRDPYTTRNCRWVID